MSKMREAFEKWWKEYSFNAEHKERMHVAFDCGYQAAIADVKAGGPFECGLCGVKDLYKLPEDV